MKRRVLVLVFALGACKSKRAATPDAEPPRPRVETPPAAEEAPPPPENNPWRADAARQAAPEAEIKKQLDALYPEIQKCFAAAGTAPKDAGLLALRFGLYSNGVVRVAELDGFPAASECVTRAVRAAHFPSWNGPAIEMLVPLSPEGGPAALPSAPAPPRDGG